MKRLHLPENQQDLYDFYTDIQTGTLDNRQGLKRLIQVAENCGFNIIVERKVQKHIELLARIYLNSTIMTLQYDTRKAATTRVRKKERAESQESSKISAIKEQLTVFLQFNRLTSEILLRFIDNTENKVVKNYYKFTQVEGL